MSGEPAASEATRAAAAKPATPPPTFLSGSLIRHVVVMAGTGAIGLVAVFAVDLINLFYISRLGEKEIAAAVGFAGVLGFFHTSICIGMMIGTTACVARRIGAGELADARRIASHSLLIIVGVALVLGLATVLCLGRLLQALGAQGEVARLAAQYLGITLPSLPLLGMGMVISALLRSVGDARRAMLVTLVAAFVTAGLDPLFIFVFGLGLHGAAMVAVLSRIVMVLLGLHGVWRVHRLLGRPQRARFAEDARAMAAIAGPAVLTNVATPVGAAFVTHSVAQFGASAVAGQATIERVTPVAFGLIYSLSGAVGPILSQNLGARQFERVRQTLRASLHFMLLAVGVAWLLLALLQEPLVRAFSLEGVSAQMVHAFCSWICASFFFAGALFVANAAFNNLGRPLWSTGFNWARATLGTMPFAWWGAQYGPVQVLAGQGVGLVIFGSLAMWTARRLTHSLCQTADASPPQAEGPKA